LITPASNTRRIASAGNVANFDLHHVSTYPKWGISV
jgi:hypothetical protein